jgi:hypothetical protein
MRSVLGLDCGDVMMVPAKITDASALKVVNDLFFKLGHHDAVEKLNIYEYLRNRLQDAVDYERRWSELVETTGRRIAEGVDDENKKP